ncbi:TPA: two-component system response regulator [candidate division WOR-3 bacterium]|uniref:Two-component system response regulator n=1 Tax=candidate division WOR-3 bacterium TaxID=2052148 RepID=A0A350H9Y4_UNCW3|nr:two-component system response regulator [candidate division WOR-3 bacterium]
MKKILIIDDDEDIISLIKIILENESYSVIGASSGEEGIKTAIKQKPELILLDIMMPIMDGWEILKMLRTEESTRKIPVAMLTCKTDVKDKLTGLQEGAIDYITKPFSPEELIERVDKIFKILHI